MALPDSLPTEAFWREDPFSFIKPEEFEALGIDPADIPPGTFPARKHPPHLPSRFGGNAYGFGFFEVYDRMSRQEMDLIHSITFEKPEEIRENSKKINRIYKNIGLLIRFSSQGMPYYLIPTHLVSSSLTTLRNKAEEISRVILYHRRKYLKESHKIGLLAQSDDLLANDLSVRFKEHQFVIIDSIEKLRFMGETLDLVIIPRDIYEIIRMDKSVTRSNEMLSKKQMENHAIYMLGKIYALLKPDGEIFLIAHRHASRTNQSARISFKTVQELKSFILFSHIFKTRKKYQAKEKSLQVNIFDFQKYLSGLYVEQEVMDTLMGDGDLASASLEEINRLPYLNFPLDDELAYDQEKVWPRLFSIYFNEILLEPLIPDSVKTEWKRRFSIKGFSPDYMLMYLVQKKPLEATISQLRKDIEESRLSGCALPLLADYKNSFDYLTRTLKVLKRIKSRRFKGMPEIFMARLRQPLENKKRRYLALNDVLRLMAKINRLERIEAYYNPDRIEGAETRVLENLETLPFLGFSYGELKEIFLIIVGHTAIGRVLSGKLNEKALKSVSDLARTYGQSQALNLLRYCRLMSMAETAASKRSDLDQEQMAELFDLYEFMVRVVTSGEMDWDRLLDERISSIGGIHNKIIRKILKMMNHFQFLHNWSELRDKGEMEKESLADYDEQKLTRIENIINLVMVIEDFENMFLKGDPLRLPIFYRKFLNMEFHGTGHLFERMDSQLAFILLWITVNVCRGEVINFNPILADVASSHIDGRVRKVEEEASVINTSYLDLATLGQLGEQLYKTGTSFILGTGFQLKVNERTQALDITYIDLDENIKRLKSLNERFTGRNISEIPIENLTALDTLFANLESFHQSHSRLLSQNDPQFKIPSREQGWFSSAESLLEELRLNFIKVIFHPENIYTELDLLYSHCRSVLDYVLPELMALQDLKLPGKIYLKSPIIDHTLASTRKIEALVRRDRESLQDTQFLHRLAQREFGPLASGTVGLNESQIETMEAIVGNLGRKQPLFDALIKSFIFRDLGLVRALREKYKDEINPANHALTSAFFLEKENIPVRYGMDKRAQEYLLVLVRYHDLLHHMIRGEFSICAIQEVIDCGDRDLFDAFFISSFIMFSAMREDLILEDLATRLFRLRDLSHKIMKGETTLEDRLDRIYTRRGRLYYALEEYDQSGLPENMTPVEYLGSWKGDESEEADYIRAGRMIYAMERIFRLRGIRYVEFPDLASLLVQVPLKFIYKKRSYFGIGYSSYEKELFEAHRIYKSLQSLPESVWHFILEHLVTDEVRIFGFENVGIYLNYENWIKLLLIGLLGSQKFKRDKRPVCLNFLDMAEEIEKRYEAVNDTLSNISVEKLWDNTNQLNLFFKAKTGLVMKKDIPERVLSIAFVDKINMPQKISYMGTITDVEQLKNYFHHSLRSLRKSPFHTEDYELQLEEAYDERLVEITDLMLDQVKQQMAVLNDLREIQNLFSDLMERALEIGFTDDQRNRLSDLYEVRKDQIRREKLDEINGLIKTISDTHELKDYWDSVKWYLMNNRPFLGKEFENLISKKFDQAALRLKKV
jgi:hypothetical protein